MVWSIDLRANFGDFAPHRAPWPKPMVLVAKRNQPTSLPPSTGMTIPVLDVRWVIAAITA
jgi:hypothetical protein